MFTGKAFCLINTVLQAQCETAQKFLNRFSGFRVIQRVKPLKRFWVGAYFDTLAKARR